MKHQNMKIGSFVRFDYESQTPKKEYKKPVKINLTDARRMELIAGIQKNAEAGEKRFRELLAAVDVKGGLTDMTLEHAEIEKGRAKGGKRSARQVELADMIKAEWARLIGSKRTGETMNTDRFGFYRQYKAERIDEKTDGKIYGCLVSKSISQSGEVLFTFLRMAPVTVEADKLAELPESERANILTV